MDLVALASFVGSTLKLHCAPMRDELVDEMMSLCESGAKGGISRGLRLGFEILELMKLVRPLSFSSTPTNSHLRISRTTNCEVFDPTCSKQPWISRPAPSSTPPRLPPLSPPTLVLVPGSSLPRPPCPAPTNSKEWNTPSDPACSTSSSLRPLLPHFPRPFN